MRFRFYSLVVAAIAVVLLPIAAEAGHRRAPRGWGEVQDVHHYGYYPRYRHVYHRHYNTDPYAYRFAPRGYYPYYNSGYWRPTHELRHRRACCRPAPRLPHYYQAWGYPKRYYNHRKWHHQHYGRHRHHHW